MKNITEINSKQNEIIKQTLKTIKDPSPEAFFIEGSKFIREISKDQINKLFITDTEKYADFINDLKPKTDIYKISIPVMEKLTGTISGQDMFAVVSVTTILKPDHLIILDRVQDSGNTGTIIRTAVAFGYGCVMSDKGANPFAQKVIRSTAGTIMNCYIKRCDLNKEIFELKNQGYKIISSVLDNTAEIPEKIDIGQKFALIVGNEGIGVSHELSELSDKKVYIPIKSAESLNVATAAAVLMYLFK